MAINSPKNDFAEKHRFLTYADEVDTVYDGSKILDGSVTTDKIADYAVTTDKIDDESITLSKMNTDVLNLLEGNVRAFETVADMQAADLNAGDICHTNGFHASGDGGAAFYKVTASGTANGMDVLACGDVFANLVITESYVTPEMFGAVGDGITNDYAALQKALSYKNVICGDSKEYVSDSTLTITNGTHLDGNNASFVFNCNVGFTGSGAVISTITASDYTANQTRYSIGEDYTGFIKLIGTNNFETSRTYYVGGFVGIARDGVLDASYPIPVTNATAYAIQPICFVIENISDIKLNYETYLLSRVFMFTYAMNAIIRNVNLETNSYASIRFDSSLGCIVENCTIIHELYQMTDNYPIALIDSSFMTVRNCNVVNPNWHCIVTGGNILCYRNIVVDCALNSDYVFAFGDHQNAVGSIVKNCTLSGIYIGGLGVVDNCVITSIDNNGAYICRIQIAGTSIKENSGAYVNNVVFMPDARVSNQVSVGLFLGSAAQVSGSSFYLDKVCISNVKLETTANLTPRIVLNTPSASRPCILGEIMLENIDKKFFVQLLTTSAVSYATITDFTLVCRNISNIQNSANYTYNNIYLDTPTSLFVPIGTVGTLNATFLTTAKGNIATVTGNASEIDIKHLKVTGFSGSVIRDFYNVVKIGSKLCGWEYDTANSAINFVDITAVSA